MGGDTVHIDLPQDTKSVSETRSYDPYTVGLMMRPVTAKESVLLKSSLLADMKYERERRIRDLFRGSRGKQTVTARVEKHEEDGNLDLLNEAYLSIKSKISPPVSHQDIHESNIFEQKTPLGSTLLHIAAAYGNDEWVKVALENAPKLLTAENYNGDMALHVAARLGHVSILRKLLPAHLGDVTTLSNPQRLFENLKEILTKNKRGNTFIHEALLCGHTVVVMNFLSFEEDTLLPVRDYQELIALATLFQTNNENQSILYSAIEAGYTEVVERALTILASPTLVSIEEYSELIPRSPDVFAGESPPLAAIMKQNRGMLDLILTKIPTWIHLRDEKGRTALHYAARRGYLDGVQYLLSKCASCAIKRDNDGFFPLHYASYGGYVEVVDELVKKKYCPDPREILDNRGRNFIHLAVESGKLGIVKYILEATDNELIREMINDQDSRGNTALHVATMGCHPKIVHALTWDNRVKLTLVNEENQTALDVCMQRSLTNLSLRQRLTWVALKSARVPYGDPRPYSIKATPSKREVNLWKEEAPGMDQYKDRINTLILVSTLIVTVTFAAGFTLPGGTKSSNPGQGMALMLHRMWFKLFIFCITISMYGAISVTIILIWAQLGDLTMAILALDVAKYGLGVTLATLSLAFLAGVHLVISDLNWLATTTLIMSVTFILMLLLLYVLLWLPGTSSSSVVRYLSYYPFLMFASLVEAKEGAFKASSSIDKSDKKKVMKKKVMKKKILKKKVTKKKQTNNLRIAAFLRRRLIRV